jgi:hypothetical protein
MSGLFPDPGTEVTGPDIAARFSAGGVRFFPVQGGYMEPDFRTSDLAAVAPIDRYDGHGIYVLDTGIGPALYGAEKIIGEDAIEVWHSNRVLSNRHRLTVADFTRSVVAKTFASVKMLDQRILRQLVDEKR